MILFQGYAPDLPPETPGVITSCEKIIPYPNGFRAQKSSQSVGADPLAGEARGFAVVKKLDNSKRIFAATSSAIYELSGTTWTDRSAVGGYSLGATLADRARFVQFGNVTIASVGTNNYLQVSTTGAFSAIAGSPKAKVVEAVNNFVFAFNFIDDTHGLGTLENGWWCSALGDYTDWTPSVATQSVSGSFIETPGPVIAAKRLGSNIVAYKENSAFIAQYVGAPKVWDWAQLSGEQGALSQECISSIGTAHYFISNEDFVMFDGSRFVSIGNPVRQTFFNELDQQYKDRICSATDRVNGLIYWFYPSPGSSGELDKCIVYNYKTDKWGRSDEAIELAAVYIEQGITFEGLGTEYSTWDDLPTTISYDSSFWTADSPVVAFFDQAHVIRTWSATPATSCITTGHLGDVSKLSTVSVVYPRFLVTPSSSVVMYSHSNGNADQMTQNITSTMSNNRYDLLWSARWHKFEFEYSGDMTILGYEPVIEPDGTE